MRRRVVIEIRTLALAVGALTGALALLAFLVAWLGLYNVAASRGHWAVTELLLRFVLENSVRARAPDVTPPDLSDSDRIRLGAAHFQIGCAQCHGSPGERVGPVARSMLPAPPNLAGRVGEWSDQELFWIVKHGLKYTGMPAWPAVERDNEVWSMVAFLRRLPGLDREGYLALAFGAGQTGSDARRIASVSEALYICARCHGHANAPPASAFVPRLNGQTAEMLEGALLAYATGERRSGFMQPVAAALDPQIVRPVAEYYAALPPAPSPSTLPADPELLARGEELARHGDPGRAVPPCLSCHGPQARRSYPRIAGQSAAFIRSQLGAWRQGVRGSTALDEIMAPIARRLRDDQVLALAAYFASLPPFGEQPNALRARR